MPTTDDVDHALWHDRLMRWSAWTGPDRGVRGFERPGRPSLGITYDPDDALAVDQLMARVGRDRLPIVAVRCYYMGRRFEDDVVGYRDLGIELGCRCKGEAWHIEFAALVGSQGGSSMRVRLEAAARVLVERGTVMLDHAERGKLAVAPSRGYGARR